MKLILTRNGHFSEDVARHWCVRRFAGWGFSNSGVNSLCAFALILFLAPAEAFSPL